MNRFKFRIWNKIDNCYSSVDLNTALTVNELVEDYFIIQQCTGLVDKNNRLIYEGDILLDRNLKQYIIIYWAKTGFYLNSINGYTRDIFNWCELEIIASITNNLLINKEGKIIKQIQENDLCKLEELLS